MTIFRLTMLAILLTTGCDETEAPQLALNVADRSIATIYKVKTDADSGQVSCFRIPAADTPDTELSQVTLLEKGQLVHIVAIEEGLRRFNDELWLRVYPTFTHRPSCYVNVNNLIPYR